MRKLSRRQWIIGVAIVAALVTTTALVAQAYPRPLVVADSAAQFSGAEMDTLGRPILEFRAGYRRWTALLGVPIKNATGIVTAERVEPMRLDVTFELSDFGRDLMRLNDPGLMLEERSFGEPGGPGQTFRRTGNAIDATVRAADGSTRDVTFTYPVPVFEPSVLELPLGLLELAVGDEGRLAWSNFNDETDFWIPFRVLRRESVAAAGRTYDTHVVRVRFPTGNQRDYWIASEPPYKVRMVSYDRGSLLKSGWDLESVDVYD